MTVPVGIKHFQIETAVRIETPVRMEMSMQMIKTSKLPLTSLLVSDLTYPVTFLRDGSDLKFYKGHILLMLDA